MSEAPKTYPICSTCKHWNRPMEPDWYPQGECDEIHSGRQDEDTAAFSSDEHRLLRTLPSFGCLLHSDLTEAGA